MKGIIFNAVHNAVVELYDEDTWDDLLDAADLDGGYTSIGTYDDAELLSLVKVGCEATGLETTELLRALGTHAFPTLAGRHPEFLENATTTVEFLRSVDTIIHPEVMKLHPDATPPRFDFEDLANGGLRMTYHSDRRLGAMAEGLIHGAAAWFGETVTIDAISEPGGASTIYDIKPVAADSAAVA